MRLAEQLERSRDQSVHACDVRVLNGTVELHLHADEDVRIARWAAERQGDLFRRAFDRELSVSWLCEQAVEGLQRLRPSVSRSA